MPACFDTRKFNPTHLRYPTFQKEFWAILDSLHFFEVQSRGHQFVILTVHKPLLTFMQRIPGSQNLRRWQDFVMTFDCSIEHNVGKNNHIADSLCRMHKCPSVSTSEDDLIPHSVDSTTNRPLQEITSNYINLSDHSATSSPTSNKPHYKMPPRGGIDFTHVDCDFNRHRGRAEIDGRHHSYPHLDEEDMEVTSEDDNKVIKKEDKDVSSDEDLLCLILEKLFERYKALSTNVNLTNGYNQLPIGPSHTPLPFRFTTSSPVTMRNESLDYLIELLEGTENPIGIQNSHKPLSNEKLAAIIRNATKYIVCELTTIHANFQQHCHQQ